MLEIVYAHGKKETAAKKEWNMLEIVHGSMLMEKETAAKSRVAILGATYLEAGGQKGIRSIS
jgi:hypothetical protein